MQGARQTQAEILEKGAGDKTGEKGISEGTAKREGVGSKQEGATWEDEDAEVLRVKLEKGEAAAMANDEDRCVRIIPPLYLPLYNTETHYAIYRVSIQSCTFDGNCCIACYE